AAPQRDAYAGRFALERADHQLTVLQEVEAHPVHIGQGVIEQGRKVRRIGDGIGLVGEQGGRLVNEVVPAREPTDFLMHGANSSRQKKRGPEGPLWYCVTA